MNAATSFEEQLLVGISKEEMCRRCCLNETLCVVKLAEHLASTSRGLVYPIASPAESKTLKWRGDTKTQLAFAESTFAKMPVRRP